MSDIKPAPNVNEVEASDAWRYFAQRLCEEGIYFSDLSDNTKAICIAITQGANYVADMIAASHHDAHGTASVSDVQDSKSQEARDEKTA